MPMADASSGPAGEPGPGTARCTRCGTTFRWETPAHLAEFVRQHEDACLGGASFVFE